MKSVMYALIFVGGAVLSLCYESVHAMCGTVAIHIAYGDVSRGKSNAVKLALAACCNYPKGYSVADLGGVRGVQMHPPLAASNIFLRT